jgi:glyoxylase-like metal-dependent hydrolase (beta-lactamase superfamily II)
LLLIFFLFNAFISNIACQNRQEKVRITDDLYYQKITDSVFLIIHYFPPPFGCNSLLVVLPDNKAVLIDTPNETSGTRSLVEWIFRRFGQSELKVINTGFHQDNLGGNDYLISFKIPVYGADLTARLIREKEDYLRKLLLESTRELKNRKYHDSYQSLHFMPPDSTFPIRNGLTMNFGDECFEVYFPGESHTIDNVVVYLHKREVLFGGCMIYATERREKGYIRDANLEEWPQALLDVKARFSGAPVVGPGHGTWGSLSLIDHTIEVLRE